MSLSQYLNMALKMAVPATSGGLRHRQQGGQQTVARNKYDERCRRMRIHHHP